MTDHTHECCDAHDHDHEHDHAYLHAHGIPHSHGHVHENQKAVLNRLSRAIGHLEKVKRMVEEGHDCSEVLIQLAAVRSALDNTGKVILKDHMRHCMVDAVAAGDQDAIDDLCQAIYPFILYRPGGQAIAFPPSLFFFFGCERVQQAHTGDDHACDQKNAQHSRAHDGQNVHQIIHMQLHF